MKKKILSMMMAGALVLSVCSTSQAAQINKDSESGKYAAGEITVAGEQSTPTISVTLSDSGSTKLYINPYGLEVTSIASITAADEKKAQLVNKVETITNDSVVDLAVNATVKATPAEGSKAKLATAALKDTDTSNSIFAYLQMDVGSTIDAKAYDSKATNQVVFASKATTKKAMAVLDKTSGTDKTAAYKILGGVTANPAQMWSEDDKVDFSIVFDFEPRVK